MEMKADRFKEGNVAIGTRIRALRKERGLSLEDLAVRCGVAASALSRIENGKGGGTYRTHRRVAEAMGLSIIELYRGVEEKEEEAVLIEPQSEEAETFLYDEKASAILLTSQTSRKQMLPQLIVLQPGGKTTVEQYRKGTERWVLCTEGTIEAKVGEKSYRVSKGGTLYFKASLPHQLANAEQTVAKIVSVMTPATW